MRILAIDPGTTALGWALYDSDSDKLLECNTLSMSRSLPMEKRLGLVEAFVADKLRSVDLLAIERMFSKRNAGDRPLYECAALVKAAARRLSVKVVELTPSRVRLLAVGYGSATKFQVAAVLGNQFDCHFADCNASDAAAIAVAAAAHLRLESIGA